MSLIEMRSPFDQAVREQGPAAVFTIDAKGRLGLDELRTREHYGRIEGDKPQSECHCLFRDRATGFVQYVLLTSPELCVDHPRQDITRFADQAGALEALRALGNPPISSSLLGAQP